MSENNNNNENITNLHDLINSIKEISAIVVVDDARTITDEEIAEIRKGLELDNKISEGENVISEFKGK
ncbi:MAG: hypothetical protein K6A80_01985 [Saccharofermentans sp.]|nr:hypothetical protein [Saccharofermentans sp.]